MDTNQNRALAARIVPLAAALALLALTVLPASAIFSRAENDAETADESAPIAQSMTVRAYRGIPYVGTLSAIDREGDEVSFVLAAQPTKGTVTIEGDRFVYCSAAGRGGTDCFRYAAVDAQGNRSASAEVEIVLTRSRTGVTYADMNGHEAYTAAVDLAERGVFVGAQVGEQRFFEPERAVSRGEFVTMALAAAGISADACTLTGFCDDADIPDWAKGGAVSALQCGLIRGVRTEDGVAFRAEEGVTLSEAASVLNRLLCLADVDLGDYHAEGVAAWSAQAAANLESAGALESGSFGAEDVSRPLTRGEAARLLAAAMTLAEEREEKGLLAGVFG